jgi:hypothetical protein
MMTNSLEALIASMKAAAEKATSGEWLLQYGDGNSPFESDDAIISREVQGFMAIAKIEGAHPDSGFDEAFQQEQQANAEFIALAQPVNVLSLIAALEARQPSVKLLAPATTFDAAAAIRACMDEFPLAVQDVVEECAVIAENTIFASSGTVGSE